MSDFTEIFNKTLGKYQRQINKAEHKLYKRVYLGKERIVTIKRKGLRKDSPKRKVLEDLLNITYLKNVGEMKQRILNNLLFGKGVM
jgi:hypothetical protein